VKFRFIRVWFQDNAKDLTGQTRPNLGTPWFISSSVPALAHRTAVLIPFPVMNHSQPGQLVFQWFLLGRGYQGLNILFMNPAKIL